MRPRFPDKSRRERITRLWLALQLGPGWRRCQSWSLYSEPRVPVATAAELCSAWTGEGARPHTGIAARRILAVAAPAQTKLIVPNRRESEALTTKNTKEHEGIWNTAAIL